MMLTGKAMIIRSMWLVGHDVYRAMMGNTEMESVRVGQGG